MYSFFDDVEPTLLAVTYTLMTSIQLRVVYQRESQSDHKYLS